MGYVYILLSNWKDTESNCPFFCQQDNMLLDMNMLYISTASLLHCFQMEKSILVH